MLESSLGLSVRGMLCDDKLTPVRVLPGLAEFFNCVENMMGCLQSNVLDIPVFELQGLVDFQIDESQEATARMLAGGLHDL